MTQEFESAITPQKEQFGEQGRGDATAEIEKTADEIAHSALEFQERVMPEIINRPPDSHPVSKQDQFDDWMSVIMDVPALQQRYQGLSGMQSIGPNRAMLELLRWDAKHRKRMSNAS